MTINYVEKGSGLHEAIRKQGQWLREENGVWVSSDDVAVQTIIDNYALTDAKSWVGQAVTSKATEYFNRAVAGYSAGELAGWSILRSEAEAYNANATASVPNITQEAQIRGCDIPTLVQKVLANANYFDNLRAQIAGTSGKHRDAVNNLTTFTDVLAYDYSTGWPAV